MEEQGYIELRIDNKEQNLSPHDVDISDIKEIISDIESFLYPTKQEKKERPHISYDLKEGSAKHRFFLPISAVILFNGLTNEIRQRNSLDFLDYKRQSIIDKFQKKALKEGVFIEFNNSISNETSLNINPSTTFEIVASPFYESEFYLYGEIYQEGGKNPNIHITSPKHGNLTVSATKEQIIDGEKRTYKVYGLKVRGKKSFEDDKLFDLKLIEYITYNPVFSKTLLNKAISRASENLSKITNVDSWINDLRAEGI